MKKGFTLIEVLIVVAVFLMIATAVSSTYVKIYKLLELNKIKIVALEVANEQIEIIRNLPYSDVGEVAGIPTGVIDHQRSIVRSGITFNITNTIRNVDDPFDGTISSSTNKDLSPADYKMVQIDVVAASNIVVSPVSIVTYVAPKNLEGASTNGALFVKVFDANGIAIQSANVHIVNNSVTPNISIDDVTNAQGLLEIVDVPPSNAYNITVTKSGYSTDKTYPNGGTGNPNPSKPDATVVVQQVTQVSFSIDALSSINFQTINQQCQPLGNISFNLTGSKLIGTPDVYKYSQNLSTNSSGLLSKSDIEWDSYTPTILSSGYDLIGSNPISPINLLPNSTQNLQLILNSKDPNTVLVGVTDSSTGQPLADATVTLSSGGFHRSLNTGRGYLEQTDWSGGSGQSDFSIENKYYSDDGNVDVGTAGELQLSKVFGVYKTNGTLISSIFDLGTSTNFKQIIWTPTDQPIATGVENVRFQIATSDFDTSTTTWSYVGPDSTPSTYFTTSNQNINASNAARYLRYKAYLTTSDTSTTPNVSDILVTYTSLCLPPGQAAFTGLSSGNYNVTVSKTGYEDYVGTINVNSSYQSININLGQ